MSFSQAKLTEPSHPEQREPEAPSTPKKKPKYTDESSPSKPRVKSITRLIQKESSNCMYSFLVLLWALFVGGAILMSYQAKIQEVEMDAVRQIDKCRLDYENNRCDNPVKGTIQYCNQKQACMRDDAKNLAERSISYMGIMGEICRQFLNGAGVIGVGVGIFLIWLSMRQKGVNRTITNVQYYQNH